MPLGSALLSALAACDGIPTELGGDFLPDGAYAIMLADPVVVDPLFTPGWMLTEPTIEFTKAGSTLTVTGSTDGQIELGPAQLITPLEASWSVRFAWATLPTDHYWEIEFTAQRCISAAAIDADLPGGLVRVPSRSCTIEAR